MVRSEAQTTCETTNLIGHLRERNLGARLDKSVSSLNGDLSEAPHTVSQHFRTQLQQRCANKPSFVAGNGK